MCGICGWLSFESPTEADPVVRMRDRMASRGPDAAGLWRSADGHACFGHRRLAILGLTEAGNQPMSTSDGRWTIVFNGEIYNFQALAKELEKDGAVFRTGTDTEVLLELWRREGPSCLPRLRGMFAFGVWDSLRRELHLARDFAGIKPLYYSRTDRGWLFASQAKALLESGLLTATVDPVGIAAFCVFGHLPTGRALHREVRELPPGTWVRIDKDGVTEPVQYLSFADLLLGPGDPRPLAEAFRDTVLHHFVSDVPVSVFLSAGKDSTTLLALASEVHGADLHAVTLGFHEFAGTADDETLLATKVAEAYGARHEVRTIGPKDFHGDLERILDAMDQPSIDGVNTYYVCRAARELGVKVALSGLGGDELLGGYPSFQQIPRLLRLTRPFRWTGSWGRRLLQRLPMPPKLSPKALSVAEYGHSVEGAYLLRRALFLPWELPAVLGEDLAREALAHWDPLEELRPLAAGMPTLHSKIAMLEIGAYMIPRLLRDSDWASMAHSLELRVPFVDLELFRALGPRVVSKHPPTKDDLVRSTSKPLPEAVVHRPKTGFQIPIRRWLAEAAGSARPAHSLRDWARLILANTIDLPNGSQLPEPSVARTP
ncbi:MAG: asparagine synthase (glutamine-hydrolyzing) [Fimbriimonadales bacterium]|nr:asparagine synthase (glutamine-hydrolyzing) [Fimbriimonadales bacterium]